MKTTLLFDEAERIRNFMETEMTGLIDIDDTAPIPGMREMNADRAQAAMLGANTTGKLELLYNC